MKQNHSDNQDSGKAASRSSSLSKSPENPSSKQDSGEATSRSGSFSKLPLLSALVGRRNSTKNTLGSFEEDSSSPRSTSPKSPPLGFFSPRLSQRQEPHFREGEALFSVCAEQAIKRDGYLSVGAGDLITFLYTKSPSKNSWIAMCAGQKGLILSADITVNHHAANIFLPAVTIVANDSQWLTTLLESVDLDFCRIENLLVPLLGTRHLLRSALEKYCVLEQSNNSIPYRTDGTPACKMISALFHADANLNKFKEEFIAYLYRLISPDSSNQRVKEKPAIETEKLPEIVENYIAFFRQQLDEKLIPASLTMVLNAIKKVFDNSSPTSLEIMLGTIFFQRFLCPALAFESSDVKRISNMLKMIIFRTPPDKEDEFFMISKKMDDLRAPLVELLLDMGSVEMEWEPEHPVVEEAAKFYYLLARKFPDNPDIQAMKKECGDEKNKAEVCARIQKISQFIQDACLVHGKGLTL